MFARMSSEKIQNFDSNRSKGTFKIQTLGLNLSVKCEPFKVNFICTQGKQKLVLGETGLQRLFAR